MANDSTWQDARGPRTVDLDRSVSTEEPTGEVPAEILGRYDAGASIALGTGGLGVVYAVRDRVIGRDVALKVLRQDVAHGDVSRGLERRFLREARITAQLQHPAIVPVHEIGRREDGTPYYTMKRVVGRTFADALRGCKTAADRLALLPHLVDVLHAVAYAHSRGIVHRDLKPDNVMVGEFGETIVLDWGLARASAEAEVALPEITMSGDHTAMGAVLGTPAYMSPEQAAGRNDAVDARSDVWSLGVMLFELAAGARPFPGQEATEVLAAVRMGVAPRVHDVAPDAPHDLAAVIERALSPDPKDRYPTARELSSEVEAWLAGRRVAAYRYGSIERVRRFVATYRAVITVAASITIVACAMAAVAGTQAARERAASRSALAEALHGSALAELDRDRISARTLAAASLALVETPGARGTVLDHRWTPELEAIDPLPPGCAGLAWSGNEAVCTERAPGSGMQVDVTGVVRVDGVRLPGRSLGRSFVAEAPARDRMAVASADRIRTWRLDGPGGRGGLYGGGIGIAEWTFSPLGRRVVSLAPTGVLGLFDAERGDLLATAEAVAGIVGFTSDGARLVVASRDGGVQSLDTEELKPSSAAHPPPATAWALLDDERVLLLDKRGVAVEWSLTRDEQIRSSEERWDSLASAPPAPRVLLGRAASLAVMDMAGGGRGIELTADPAAARALSADGRRLALGGPGRRVVVYDAETGKEVRAHDLAADVRAITLSADGEWLAVATTDAAVCLFLAAEDRLLARIEAHREPVARLAFSPDGRLLLTAGADGLVRSWDLRLLDVLGAELLGRAERAWGVRFEGGGLRVAP